MATTHTKKKIAVVLSGAGLQGLASIAIKDFLDLHSITPDLLIGCSGGAIVAGLWAMGYDTPTILSRLKKDLGVFDHKSLQLKTFLRLFYTPFGTIPMDASIYKPDRYRQFLIGLFDTVQIESQPIRLQLQATHFNTGEPATIATGLLWQGVFASSAMLPFYPAIEMNGEWYADCVYSMPIPITPAMLQQYDVIIAINCKEISKKTQTNFMSFYANFISQATLYTQKLQHSYSISLHHGEIYIIDIPIPETSTTTAEALFDFSIDTANKIIAKKSISLLSLLQ